MNKRYRINAISFICKKKVFCVDFRAAQVTLFLYSLAIFFSYALQFYVGMEILGRNVIAPAVPDRWLNTADFFTRIVLNVITRNQCLKD